VQSVRSSDSNQLASTTAGRTQQRPAGQPRGPGGSSGFGGAPPGASHISP